LKNSVVRSVKRTDLYVGVSVA